MARSVTGKDAPDPSLGGSIRFIVRSAHKWGGNGVIPLFNKIKRVLMSKHPEVIAKSFGGDANKAAAWIKDNWMAMHGHDPTHWRGKGKSTAQQLATSFGEDEDSPFWDIELDYNGLEDLYQEVPLSAFDADGIELFMADPTADEEKDGLLWHPVCRTGEWVRSPTGKGKLQITKQHFDDALDAFRNKAWENVTIPLTHEDRVDENTGYIRDMEVREDPTRPGEFRLWAAHEFTEPDIKDKVKRKSIIGRSVLLSINKYRDTETGKLWPAVIKHVSLTNKPWINGLNDGVVLSQDGDEVESYEPADEIEVVDEQNDPEDQTAEVISLLKKIQEKLFGAQKDDAGNDPDEDPEDEVHEAIAASIESLDDDPDSKSDNIHGKSIVIVKGGVAKMGEKNENGEVKLSQEEFDATVAKAAQDAVAAEREAWQKKQDALEARLSQQEAEAHELKVDKLMAAYQEKGVPPATLTRVRDIMLATPDENGDIKLSIEEGEDDDKKVVEYTLSQHDAIISILDTIPTSLLEKDQKDLSLAHTGGGTPPVEKNATSGDPEESKKKSDALWEEMHSPVTA